MRPISMVNYKLQMIKYHKGMFVKLNKINVKKSLLKRLSPKRFIRILLYGLRLFQMRACFLL